MSRVRELHNQAMMLAAQQAFVPREAGALTEAEELARQALPLEVRAAKRLANTPENEPTRSILYRSATALAYQANDIATALSLAIEGLTGYPLPRIEQELKDLHTQIDEATTPTIGV